MTILVTPPPGRPTPIPHIRRVERQRIYWQVVPAVFLLCMCREPATAAILGSFETATPSICQQYRPRQKPWSDGVLSPRARNERQIKREIPDELDDDPISTLENLGVEARDVCEDGAGLEVCH